ncbi:S-methyl-5'-thioadenosine phosphorylase [Mucisphaera calidilacus]|uniref:Purine nucleoside phosphorylase n=1 Tax=Mucisphaera calidilacus TaxID=2527982 RepID=A0A518BTM6_9BACT|nr:S-methyl-5'-thioadenosine phosphorylase [Mucisphaera calidilacus]QDU70324.1 S-methyl-5'-thioadenosine phosphorylase [Mucisphaera calidilacus]
MSETTMKLAVIGGSGLGDALGGEKGEVREVETPFGSPSGPIVETEWSGTPVYLLQRHGPGHLLNPSQVPYRANIYALKSLGVTHVVASGAVGSLRESVRPGDLMIPDQVIDKTTKRANTFYDAAAVHVELAEPFCPVMRRWLLEASERLASTRVVGSGTYVCMEGPAFSTRAESELHRSWGADLIGMTVMPEAKLAREAELAYALVALPTDFDCWRPVDPDQSRQDLLAEIIGNLQKATAASLALIREALSDLELLAAEPSPAHRALALGIWSDKAKIPPEEVERLGVLWGRYFKGEG